MNKHPFNNCAAWSKGWYQMRPNVHSWWMDLAHCINNDGWCGIITKQDVVSWILNRFDMDREWFEKSTNISFSHMYSEVQKYMNWYNKDEDIDIEDAIILYFRNVLSMQSKKEFDGGFRPSSDVLPLFYHKAYYFDESNYVYNGKPSYTPAEMRCDVLQRINDSFPELPEQEVDDYDKYETIEGSLLNKNFRDVQIPVGSDCIPTAAKFIFITTGDRLNGRTSINLGDNTYGQMGMFSHSIGFDKDKNYELTMEITKDDWSDDNWSDDNYTVKNIREL